MKLSIVTYLVVVFLAALAAAYITSPAHFDPACQGQDIAIHCVD